VTISQLMQRFEDRVTEIHTRAPARKHKQHDCLKALPFSVLESQVGYSL